MKNKELLTGQAAFSAEMVAIWTAEIKALLESPDFVDMTPSAEWRSCHDINVRGVEPRRVDTKSLNVILKDMGREVLPVLF